MSPPKKRFKSSDIIKTSPERLAEFDLIPIKMECLALSMNNEPVVVLSTSEKRIALVVNNIESTMIAFIHSGCMPTKHINNIYDLYMANLKDTKTFIESVTIEARQGDMVYGRLCLNNNKKRRIFAKCSAGDAIILSSLTNVPLQIVRKVIEDMDEFEMQFVDDNGQEELYGEDY